MLTEILEAHAECDWNLLDHVNQQDPMEHDFSIWQRTYQLKWAISKALAPDSILEIGVRYGYSAFAFLGATPGCWYLGLDNDGDESGGVRGSLKWAASKLRNYAKASVLKTDTQKLDKLPGDVWDLIHVDGKQTGASTNHDMSLALNQARYILIDGYWWTDVNFDAINDWLMLNKKDIEWHIVINDAGSVYGDVLIKVRQ